MSDETESSRLRKAVSALEEANARLARSAFDRADAGGAALVAGLEERLAAAEEELESLRAELETKDDRIRELAEVAHRNDALYQQQVRWNDARRYRIADAVHVRLARLRRLPKGLLGRG